jgi:hypothetical protein
MATTDTTTITPTLSARAIKAPPWAFDCCLVY